MIAERVISIIIILRGGDFNRYERYESLLEDIASGTEFDVFGIEAIDEGEVSYYQFCAGFFSPTIKAISRECACDFIVKQQASKTWQQQALSVFALTAVVAPMLTPLTSEVRRSFDFKPFQQWFPYERLSSNQVLSGMSLFSVALAPKTCPLWLMAVLTNIQVVRSEISDAWIKTWGGSNEDIAEAIALDTDGGWAMTGYTESYGAGLRDAFIARYSANGTLLWSRTWGGDAQDEGYALARAADGGWALAGKYGPVFGVGNWDAFYRTFLMILVTCYGHGLGVGVILIMVYSLALANRWWLGAGGDTRLTLEQVA